MKRSRIVTLGLLGALAGCGGGGGGGGGSMPQTQMPQPQNLKAAPAPQEPFNVGSLTETYSVAANGPSSLLLSTYASGTVNGSSVNETILYVVDSSGAVTLDSVQLAVNGTPFVFTAYPWEY